MEEITTESFVLETPSKDLLRGDLRWKEQAREFQKKKLPVVIICHGFKAFKDWGPFPEIGKYFAKNGFVSIVINFSHNGIGVEPNKFVEHEKFSKNTITLEVEDIKTVLTEIQSNCFGYSFIDKSKVALIGHSRGGGVSIITAHEDERVKAMVAWSTIANFNRYTNDQKHRWREKGYIQLHSVSDHNLFRISTALLDDLEQNIERFNILRAAEHLQKPMLLVHGTADIPAKIEESEKIYAVADKTITDFIKLEGVGHMYGAKHPYKEESPTLNYILNITADWLHKHLQTED